MAKKLKKPETEELLKIAADGFPVMYDKDGVLNKHIKKSSFFTEAHTTQESTLAYLEYTLLLADEKIKAIEDKLKHENEKHDLICEEISCIGSGKKSKRLLEIQESKLLEKLAKIRKEAEEV